MLYTVVTQSNLTLKLVFWRFAVLMTEFALEHKAALLKTLPYIPLVGCGAAAYLLGRLVGVIVQILFL
jgi:hypothetical protein